MDKTSIGDRMKGYEDVFKYKLPRRMPVIIRLDGRAFHSWTRQQKCERPFDEKLISSMQKVAMELCGDIQGAMMAFVQSDEISILVHNYKKLNSEPWFANEVQKITSISAAKASSVMSLLYNCQTMFDSRVFVLPEAEVCNYFIWRQQDATRNSIQMVAQHHFSHRQCQGKSCDELQEMLFSQKQINWNDLPSTMKRGSCITKSQLNHLWVVEDIPIFSQNRNFIEKFLAVESD